MSLNREDICVQHTVAMSKVMSTLSKIVGDGQVGSSQFGGLRWWVLLGELPPLLWWRGWELFGEFGGGGGGYLVRGGGFI